MADVNPQIETLQQPLGPKNFIELQKVFSLDNFQPIIHHEAELRPSGGIIDNKKLKESTELKVRGGEKTNLVDFISEDNQLESLLRIALSTGNLNDADIQRLKDRGVLLARTATGLEQSQKIIFKKNLTQLNKAEVLALIIEKLGDGNNLNRDTFINTVVRTFNEKVDRLGSNSTIPFDQIDYLDAMTVAGAQSLYNALIESGYRPYDRWGEKDAARRKVASQVTPVRGVLDVVRQLSEVTAEEGKGMDIFKKDEIPRMEESASVDLRGAQMLYKILIPSDELIAIGKLERSIAQETDLGKREELRHQLVKERAKIYVAILQANGVSGYERGGAKIRALVEKGFFTEEDVKDIEGTAQMKDEQILRDKKGHIVYKEKGLAEKIRQKMDHFNHNKLNLSEINKKALVDLLQTYIKSGRGGTGTKNAIERAINSLSMTKETITALENQFLEYPQQTRTARAYEQLWKNFLEEIGVGKRNGPKFIGDETPMIEEILKQVFQDTIRTEIALHERKPGSQTGIKYPSEVAMIDIETQALKGVDLLLRRSISTRTGEYSSPEDYAQRIRQSLEQISQLEASQEVPGGLTQQKKEQTAKPPAPAPAPATEPKSPAPAAPTTPGVSPVPTAELVTTEPGTPPATLELRAAAPAPPAIEIPLNKVETQLTALSLTPDQFQKKEVIENQGTPQEKKVTVYTLNQLMLLADKQSAENLSTVAEILKQEGTPLMINNLTLEIPENAVSEINLGNLHQIGALKVEGQPSQQPINLQNVRAETIEVGENLSARLAPVDLDKAPIDRIYLSDNSTLLIDKEHLAALAGKTLITIGGLNAKIIVETAGQPPVDLSGKTGKYKIETNPTGNFTLVESKPAAISPPPPPPPPLQLLAQASAAQTTPVAEPMRTEQQAGELKPQLTEVEVAVPQSYCDVGDKAGQFLVNAYKELAKSLGSRDDQGNLKLNPTFDKVVRFRLERPKLKSDFETPDDLDEYGKNFAEVWRFVRQKGGNAPIGYLYDNQTNQVVFIDKNNVIKKQVFTLTSEGVKVEILDLKPEEYGKVQLFNQLKSVPEWPEIQKIFETGVSKTIPPTPQAPPLTQSSLLPPPPLQSPAQGNTETPAAPEAEAAAQAEATSVPEGCPEGWMYIEEVPKTKYEQPTKNTHYRVNNGIINVYETKRAIVEQNNYWVDCLGLSVNTIGENKDNINCYESSTTYVINNEKGKINLVGSKSIVFIPDLKNKGEITYYTSIISNSTASEAQVFGFNGVPTVENTEGHVFTKNDRQFVIVEAKNNQEQKAYAVFEKVKTKGGKETLILVDGRREDDVADLISRLSEKTGLQFTREDIETNAFSLQPPVAPAAAPPTTEPGAPASQAASAEEAPTEPTQPPQSQPAAEPPAEEEAAATGIAPETPLAAEPVRTGQGAPPAAPTGGPPTATEAAAPSVVEVVPTPPLAEEQRLTALELAELRTVAPTPPVTEAAEPPTPPPPPPAAQPPAQGNTETPAAPEAKAVAQAEATSVSEEWINIEEVPKDKDETPTKNTHYGVNNGIINVYKTKSVIVEQNNYSVYCDRSSTNTVGENKSVVYCLNLSTNTVGENKGVVNCFELSTNTVVENNSSVGCYESSTTYVINNEKGKINLVGSKPIVFIPDLKNKGEITYRSSIIDDGSSASEAQVFGFNGVPTVENTEGHVFTKNYRQFVIVEAKNNQEQKAYAVFEKVKTKGGKETLILVDGRKEEDVTDLISRLSKKTGLQFTREDIETNAFSLQPPVAEPPVTTKQEAQPAAGKDINKLIQQLNTDPSKRKEVFARFSDPEKQAVANALFERAKENIDQVPEWARSYVNLEQAAPVASERTTESIEEQIASVVKKITQHPDFKDLSEPDLTEFIRKYIVNFTTKKWKYDPVENFNIFGRIIDNWDKIIEDIDIPQKPKRSLRSFFRRNQKEQEEYKKKMEEFMRFKIIKQKCVNGTIAAGSDLTINEFDNEVSEASLRILNYLKAIHPPDTNLDDIIEKYSPQDVYRLASFIWMCKNKFKLPEESS